VTEGDEMSVLQEAVHHREDDRLAAHLRESLHEVEGDVAPNSAGHDERLKEARWVKVLYFVPLANRAAFDVVADELVVARCEGGAQVLQRLLDALLAHDMGVVQHLRPGRGTGRQEKTVVVEHHVVSDCPLRPGRPCRDILFLGDDLWQRVCLVVELIKQFKIGDGKSMYHGRILAVT
jgi:hypothetical protein